MIPIKDDNPTQTFPIITIVLIVLNVVIYAVQVSLGDGAEAFIYRFGAIPFEISHFQELPKLPFAFQTRMPNIFTLITAMFLHGGLFHLLGNMLYLWIFGDNVEAIMGSMRFLAFYLLCGLIAALSHIIIEPNSTVPMVGASGAISGVLGAYFLRFPRARVHVLIIFFFIFRVIRVSALFVLGFWFLIQLSNGLGQMKLNPTGSGVAWFAHIGGFIAGMILVYFFEKKHKTRIYGRRGWWW